jgi:hypothetical protein
MQSPREHEGADGRPRLSVVISELRSREPGLGRERRRRLPAGRRGRTRHPGRPAAASVDKRPGRLVAR